MILKDRESGILLHISSLPGNYGIGTLGKEAYHFVDFLERSKQRCWQILPLGTTSFGDSPYQSFSAFAGNPYLINLEFLVESGILSQESLDNANLESDPRSIDYEKLYNNKIPLLKEAYKNFINKKENIIKLKDFVDQNEFWLGDFSLFMALKDKFNGKPWLEWPRDIRVRDKEALLPYKMELAEERKFHIFNQFIFFKQWQELKEYANSKEIKIFGDIPIFVSEDSSDAWAFSHLFQFDKDRKPVKVAGVPPDYFSETGQLWGNPLYDWEEVEKDNYEWWIKRVKASFYFYDILRIDHFRGFEAYWSIDYGAKTAINGKWVKGPGIKLFNALKRELGELPIVAEDLGVITKEVKKLREDTGFPGMKVLGFAFDSTEENDFLPHTYDKNFIVYVGTHDNDTIIGWYKKSNDEDKRYATHYLNLTETEGINWGFIRGAMSSVAKLSIIQMQDLLGYDSWARMNTPSTLGINWRWRVTKSELSAELSNRLAYVTKLYGRYKTKNI